MSRRLLLGATALLVLAAPAAAHAQDFVIENATVATGDGSEPMQNASVIVRGGRIASVGSTAGGEGLQRIDGTGLWVTPGLVASVTTLGLNDVGGVSESNDVQADDSPFSAALDAAPVINPNSQHIMVHRAAGITRAATAVMPSSSIFGGQGAIIDLGADGQPITRARAFQLVALGEEGAHLSGGSRASAHTLFRNALREALDYEKGEAITRGGTRTRQVDQGDDMPPDNRLAERNGERASDVLLTRFDAAALVPVVRGAQKLYVMVERASDIRSVLALKKEFPALDMVLVGASEGWLVAPEIAAAGVPVIADGLDDLPQSFEQLAATQSNIGRLVKAGVKVAINAAAMENPRNLNQYAGNLVALSRMPGADGLSWGQAFATITSVPAEISGLRGRAGSLVAGASGDVVLWDGDPLEVGAMPVRVFIDGVEQPLDNHQSRLKERYRDLDESDQPKAYDW